MKNRIEKINLCSLCGKLYINNNSINHCCNQCFKNILRPLKKEIDKFLRILVLV